MLPLGEDTLRIDEKYRVTIDSFIDCKGVNTFLRIFARFLCISIVRGSRYYTRISVNIYLLLSSV